MKILYVTARPPYPPYKGDQLISYEQIRNLSDEHYEIFLVSFIRNDKEKNFVIRELNPYCKKIFFIKINKLVIFLNLAKTLINLKPFEVNMYTNHSIIFKINKIYDDVKPDIIHIQTIRLGELLKDKKIPKVLDMIDILSLNMERRSLKEKCLLKYIFKIESKLLKRYEENIISKYNIIALVSRSDLYNSHLKNKKFNIRINPNGTYINKEYLTRYESIEKENIIIFHGNMSYFPNIEAMIYFTNEIWPYIVDKYPEYKLFIVGKDPVNKIKKLNNTNNIVVTGFVKDICEYLCKARIGVYPLNSGTGMQNKILEALACGLPCIASNYAIQGIPDITVNDIIIANKKEEFINAIEYLINSDISRKKYATNGQNFVYNNYSWKTNVNNLKSMWESAFINHL